MPSWKSNIAMHQTRHLSASGSIVDSCGQVMASVNQQGMQPPALSKHQRSESTVRG
jgi:hypothetical protein